MPEIEGEQSGEPEEIGLETGSSPETAAENIRIEEFLERYATSVDRYGADSSLSVEVIRPDRAGKDQPASWAIDLDWGKIYADPKFFLEKGYELADADFAIKHEVEHFRELRDLLNEPDGYQIWQAFRQKAIAKQRFGLLNNCLDDIRMNRTVVARAPALEGPRAHLYQDKLFPRSNLSVDSEGKPLPKHLQFAYTCLRERMLPNEQCKIDAAVRAEIDRLQGLKDRSGRTLLEVMTDPKLSPSQRLKLQEHFFEPVFEKFFEEDVAEWQQQQSGQGGGESSGQGEGQPQNGQPEGQSTESVTAESQSEAGDQSNSTDQTTESGSASSKPLPASGSGNPEDFFRDLYEEYFANSPDAALDQKAVEQIFEQYAKEHGLDVPASQRSEAAYARAEGVTVNDLRSYRQLWERVSELRNPETNETVIDELRAIFQRIIAERTRPQDVPYAPQTEGEILINPVQAYTDVLAGKEESEAWLTHRQEDQPAEKTGQFDVTLICDRSGSMQSGSKGRDQLLSAVLIMEALKGFSDELDEVRIDLKDDLQVRTEIRSFGAGEQLHDVLKPLSSELTERQRVAVAKALHELSGNTPDFLPLEAILKSLTEKDKLQMKSGSLRKIVIPLSDGDSDEAARTQRALKGLRDQGVTIAALGMGSSANSIAQTYAPDGQVVPDTKQLSVVLGQVLEGFLSKL